MAKYKIVKRWNPILALWRFDARDMNDTDILYGFDTAEDCEKAMSTYRTEEYKEVVVKEVEIP